ncbi:hypothetical protein MKZ38_002437 [Zalerion maritima]|uniref:ferric-chelate reductase (NADPH) n=1 Tax=Zalerion maritima TaxID=339359 RepID=A0AAD5RNV7_9PEZI|nr:hypothetical protein MKZ38_002437 [Zalerion maritima]
MDYSPGRQLVSTTTGLIMARAESTASAETANPTIAPYHTNLDGVNQPVNLLFADMLWWTLGIFGFAVLAIHVIELVWAKVRQVGAMHVPGDQQTYWKLNQWGWMPAMKKHLIYAPFWNKRHNREFKLSSAVSMGTLPSRLHSLLLFVIVLSNIVYMLYIDWTQENKYAVWAEIRGRSGTLSMIQMLPLIIFAGRNNPLIHLLAVSFDTYNIFHRNIGRLVVLEALIHTVAWAVVAGADGGGSFVVEKILHDRFIASGFAGTVAMVILMLLSVSPIRHAFYETFLNVHIILAFVTFVGTYIHCIAATIPGVGALPQVTIAIAIFALWFADRLARMLRIVYYNWSSRGMTEAFVEAMPGETCRVTLHLPRYVDVKPGSHAYLRFAQANWWESHPFSIAWVEHSPETKTLPITEKESCLIERKAATSVSFIIGAHTGVTRKLYNKAVSGPTQVVSMRANFEGPYGGHHSLDSYGHAVLFAGATGITHQISYLKPLIEGFNNQTVATRKITLVWIVRDYEALEWVKPWMNEVLRMPNRKDILNIKLFITRPKNASEITSSSQTVQMFPGRPNIPTLLHKECSEQKGAMMVSVCGPGALADDVRFSVRQAQDYGYSLSLVEESFTVRAPP